MKTLKLDSETMKLLDRIRAEADTLMLDGVDFDLAEQAVRELARPALDKVKMTRLQQDQYRWYLRELTGLLAARTGWDLAFELELLLRKWTALGLASDILQAALRQVYTGLVAPQKPGVSSETSALRDSRTNRQPDSKTANCQSIPLPVAPSSATFDSETRDG